MPDPVYITLSSNGNRIRGDSTVSSLGREGTIEALSFEYSVSIQRSVGGGTGSSRRSYTPIVFRKRIDRSTPLLFKALTNNENVTAECRFFRPNTAGTGTSVHFYSIEIENARVVGIKLVGSDSGGSNPILEEISIEFASITETYIDGGIEHNDTWTLNH